MGWRQRGGIVVIPAAGFWWGAHLVKQPHAAPSASRNDRSELNRFHRRLGATSPTAVKRASIKANKDQPVAALSIGLS